VFEDEEINEEITLRVDKYLDTYLSYRGREIHICEKKLFKILKQHMEVQSG
jgi:hypothetical protein